VSLCSCLWKFFVVVLFNNFSPFPP
jgi:hypothetical protein